MRRRTMIDGRLLPCAALAPMLALCSGPGLAADAGVPDAVGVGVFSALTAGGALPAGWSRLSFRGLGRGTRYDVVSDHGTTVLRARAEAGASGLVRRIRIDPHRYPILRWRWKVTTLPRGTDLHRREGDDAAARVYVTFAYDPARLGPLERLRYEAARLFYGQTPPLRALTYVWSGAGAIGTILPNPYTARVQMIVVESGARRAGEWITEQRNVERDYRHAFGEAPPPISGVAIMTDADNTGSRAAAYYGDIGFRRAVSASPVRQP